VSGHYPSGVDLTRPIAALDVDGVISLFGFRCAEESSERGDMHLIDGIPHCISRSAGPLIARLADRFDLVWATGWEDRANDHLPYLIGVREDLPVINFPVAAEFGNAHWKLTALETYAVGRPLAWIDDNLNEQCREWAAARPEPTLLVLTECDRGIEEGHVEAMCAWVDAGYTHDAWTQEAGHSSTWP